jgi:uncharacterized protein (DUF1697 family)
MAIFIVLLRAVNVGGTGKLPMTEFKAMCVAEGYTKVKTYIASGNVFFESKDDAATIKAALEKELEAYAGKQVGVVVRTAKEMAAVLASNPFPQADGSRTVAIFLEHHPGIDAFNNLKGHKNEELRLGVKEVFVHYPDGIGQSKLIIPAAKAGTARNMNTVAKLVELAVELST